LICTHAGHSTLHIQQGEDDPVLVSQKISVACKEVETELFHKTIRSVDVATELVGDCDLDSAGWVQRDSHDWPWDLVWR